MDAEQIEPGGHLSCPSYVAKPGADLFGIVGRNGELEYLPATISIDKTFVEEAQKGRLPESRFRFAGKCIQNACLQWEAGKCGLIEKVIQLNRQKPEFEVQKCAIRSTCRWFAQEHERACASCSEIFRNKEIQFFQAR